MRVSAQMLAKGNNDRVGVVKPIFVKAVELDTNSPQSIIGRVFQNGTAVEIEWTLARVNISRRPVHDL